MKVSIRGDRRILVGSALALTAAFFYGASNVVAKKTMGDYHVPPLLFTAFATLFGTLLLFPLCYRNLGSDLKAPGKYLWFIVAAGICSGGAITVLNLAVSRADVVVVSPLSSLNPVVTLVLAHLFLQRLEKVTLRVVIGTLMAVAGAALVVIGSAL